MQRAQFIYPLLVERLNGFHHVIFYNDVEQRLAIGATKRAFISFLFEGEIRFTVALGTNNISH